MYKQEINRQILDIYNDSTYQELKVYYDKTTIFNVLGVERSETRHSAFLCFFHLALVAGNAKVQGRKECRHLMEETDKQESLARIWQSNEDISIAQKTHCFMQYGVEFA